MHYLMRKLLSVYLQASPDAAGGGGTAAPPAAAPGAAASASAAPPGSPATPAAADGVTPGGAAAPAPNVIADAKPAAAEAPKEPTAQERDAYLTEKGVKAEELAKLDDAARKAKFEELKAADTRTAAAAKIEINVPEGIEIDEKTLTSFKEIIADAKLSPSERGQKLADMHASALKAAVEGPVKEWMDTQAKWTAEVKADPEMGGQNFNDMTATIAKAIDAIGGDKAKAMREAFIFTGAGNHPEIVRLMYRMGKALTEGGHVAGAAPGAAGKDVAQALATMYPSSAEGKQQASA